MNAKVAIENTDMAANRLTLRGLWTAVLCSGICSLLLSAVVAGNE